MKITHMLQNGCQSQTTNLMEIYSQQHMYHFYCKLLEQQANQIDRLYAMA